MIRAGFAVLTLTLAAATQKAAAQKAETRKAEAQRAEAQEAGRPTASPQQPVRPRVLLFGDQGLQNHHRNAMAVLKAKAEVVQSPLGYLPTGVALDRLDDLLGEKAFDVVVFNFGLADIMCRDPRTKRIRAMSPKAGGVPVTPIDRYEANLEAFVTHLSARGIKLVWTSTPPVHPHSRSSAIDEAQIPSYNARALAVMKKHGVPVVDVYAQIRTKLAEVKNPRQLGRAHNDLLKKDLSGPLVAAIAALAQPNRAKQ